LVPVLHHSASVCEILATIVTNAGSLVNIKLHQNPTPALHIFNKKEIGSTSQTEPISPKQGLSLPKQLRITPSQEIPKSTPPPPARLSRTSVKLNLYRFQLLKLPKTNQSPILLIPQPEPNAAQTLPKRNRLHIKHRYFSMTRFKIIVRDTRA
jgi:hypothetical protein